MDEKSRQILIASLIEQKELIDWHWERGQDNYADSQYEELKRLAAKLRDEIDRDTATGD
jgi:hypothetical protein